MKFSHKSIKHETKSYVFATAEGENAYICYKKLTDEENQLSQAVR